MLPPENLDEMVKFIEYKKKIDLECDEKKKDINLIIENVVILGVFLIKYKYLIFI